MSPRPDVSKERRARKQSDIIQAALACFIRKGYNNTTMDDIVAGSGLSKGSLYWYFKSKDELFTKAILSVLASVGQDTFTALEQCATPSDKLRAIAQIAANLGKEIEGFFGLILEFWASSPNRDESGQAWLDALVQYKDLVVEIVEEGVREEEFKPVDAEPLAWAMLAAYDGLAAYAMMMPDVDIDNACEVFVETLLSGLVVDG